MSFITGIVLTAIVMAAACALPGVFIALRGSSMLVDAISHAILPGIVLGFWFTQDLKSPWLVLGAALAGMIVVQGAEWLGRSRLITGDAPQGLVFPALFALGVIMISAEFANVHLDTHAVLVGDLNLATFDQLTVGGVTLGPVYLFQMLAVLILNIAFVTLFYPQLTLSTFDPEFARTQGLKTGLLNSVFMLLVAITVTAAFNGAGSVLVLALMIIPAATALLITRRLHRVILVAVAVAIIGAVGGFWAAYVLDAATSAGIAVFYGIVFGIVLCARLLRNRSHRRVHHGHIAGTAKTNEDTQPAGAH